MSSFRFSPDTYLDWVLVDVPCFDEMQDRLAEETRDLRVERALELGIGTGETARRVLALHERVQLIGVDASEAMLARARELLPPGRVRLVLGRLQDALPAGEFQLVYSALAVHHLDAREKADLFLRIGRSLRPGGRFLLADLVVPERSEDAVAPVSEGLDRPDTVSDQLRWLAEAGLEPRLAWSWRDFALLMAIKPTPSSRSL